MYSLASPPTPPIGHVNKVSHVFTLSHVAEMLGEDEEWLLEVAEEMDTEDGQLWVCAVKRRRFPVGASPTRQPLQPEATGAVMEVTKWLKLLVSVSRYTVTARVCRP